MALSLRTWITFFLLAIILGLNNIYSTLLTGWGDGGSIVAVILCVLFLAKNKRDSINLNLGQTMASAGGSVGFAVAIIASIYYSESQAGRVWEPPLFDLSLLVLALSLMGVALAVPLRGVIVHWFFPSAVACAAIIRAVTSQDEGDRKHAKRVMGVSGLISALLTLPAKVAFTKGAGPFLKEIPLGKGLALSVDPLLYGIGLVVGPRIGFSLLLGALAHAFLMAPNLSGEEIRWSAVGLMTLPAFTSLLFAFLFKCKLTLPPGFHPVDKQSPFLLWQKVLIGAIFILALAVAAFQMQKIFGVSWTVVCLAALVAAPMCFALGKVASETDINPVRLLAIALLMIFSVFERHSPVQLLSIGIAGATFAAIAVDLFYDLRTGYLIRANPKQQIVMQFLGVIPVAFVAVYFLSLITTRFGLGEGEYFPAPGAIIWATMAEAFSLGGEGVSLDVWKAAGIASVVGVLFTFLEAWKVTHRFTPSSFALGIALLLPFEMCAAIFLGSILRFGKDDTAVKAGSAIFAASSLAGIIAVILISLGVVYLPRS